MTKQVQSDRTMDIHLLTQVADDGSPFGETDSTRCGAGDAPWREMAEQRP